MRVKEIWPISKCCSLWALALALLVLLVEWHSEGIDMAERELLPPDLMAAVRAAGEPAPAALPPALSPAEQADQNLEWARILEGAGRSHAPIPESLRLQPPQPVAPIVRIPGMPPVSMDVGRGFAPLPEVPQDLQVDAGKPQPLPPESLGEFFGAGAGAGGIGGRAGGGLSVSSSRSGPATPGALSTAIGDLSALDVRSQEAVGLAGEPYLEPVTDAEGKLIAPDDPGYRRALVDELSTLAGKGKLSDAEIARVEAIKNDLAIDTTETKATEQIRVGDAQARQVAVLAKAEATAQDDYRKTAKLELGKLDGLMQSFTAEQVDPNRLLGGAGKRIGAALAVALGAFGSAITGGPNSALDIITKAIDRDIAAQEQDIKRAGAAVGMQKSLMGQMRSQFADEGVARAAARVAMNEATASRLRRINLDFATQEKQDRAAELEAALAAKTESDRRDLEMKVIQGEQQRATIRGQLGATQEKQAISARMSLAKMMTKRKIGGPPPGLALVKGDYIPTEKDKEKAQAMASSYEMARGPLDELMAWRTEHQSETSIAWTTEIAAEGKQLANEVIIALKIAKEMGANFTELEKDLLGIPEDPGEYGHVMAKLRVIRETMASQTIAKMRSYGYTMKAEQGKGGMQRSQVGQGD